MAEDICLNTNCDWILENWLHLFFKGLVIFHAATWTALYSMTYFIFMHGIHGLNSQDYARNTLEIHMNTYKYQ